MTVSNISPQCQVGNCTMDANRAGKFCRLHTQALVFGYTHICGKRIEWPQENLKRMGY